MTAAANAGATAPDCTTWDGIRLFLNEMFGDWLGRGQVWTTGFRSVGTGESWHGRGGVEWLERAFGDQNADLYFAIGLMGFGAARRSSAGVVAQPVLIVDDVGTKVDRAKWEALFLMGCPRPTAQIETSPGNETWLWALDGDATDPQRWQDLALIRAWLIDQKLTDEVMDVARYVRLPGGWNSKPKYLGAGGTGEPPRVTLVEWRGMGQGGARVDVDRLGAFLVGLPSGMGVGGGAWAWRAAPAPTSAGAQAALTGAQLGGGALARTADVMKPDALMRLGMELGMGLTQRGPGVVEALCPNIGAHGARAETGFAFLGSGLMHCNHASCQGFGTVDFRRMMMEQLDEKEGREGAGLEFMARETFADMGVGSAAELAETQAVASQMAAARAARVATAAAVTAAGLDGLAERFVWVNPVGSFFDTQERRVIPGDLIDTHEAVLDVIPVGRSGEKRARNILLNHPGMRRVGGVVREAGVADAVVAVADEQGRVKDMANIWVAGVRSGVRVPGGVPSEWLELLEYVVPDADYRGWFIQWLAWGMQRPRERRMTIPLIVGAQGIGKDAILGPIEELMGRHNVERVSMGRLAGNFTEWMLKDLVILPELKLSGDGKMYNQIKDWLSNAEEWVSINEKFVRPYQTRVNFSLIAMTNHLDAVQGMEQDDRRWQVYISPARKGEAEFYRRLIEGANTDAALARLLDYLLSVDLTGFSPFTEAPGRSARDKAAMLADTLKGAAQWALQSVQAGGQFHGRNVLTLKELEDAALVDPNRRVSSGVDTYLLRNGLKAAGWESIGQTRAGQDRLSFWVSPALRNNPMGAILQPKIISAIYLSEKNASLQSQTNILLGK